MPDLLEDLKNELSPDGGLRKIIRELCEAGVFTGVQRQLKRYLSRRPEETVLYRVIYHHRDEFERRWDELFLESYGSLRREALELALLIGWFLTTC